MCSNSTQLDLKSMCPFIGSKKLCMRSYVRTYIVILRKAVFLVKQNSTCNRFISMATINKMSHSVFTILILMQLFQKIAVVKIITSRVLACEARQRSTIGNKNW